MSTRTKGRGCDGKRQNPTKDAARDQLASLVRRGASPARFQVYRCEHCRYWHIGHRPKPKRNRR